MSRKGAPDARRRLGGPLARRDAPEVGRRAAFRLEVGDPPDAPRPGEAAVVAATGDVVAAWVRAAAPAPDLDALLRLIRAVRAALAGERAPRGRRRARPPGRWTAPRRRG